MNLGTRLFTFLHGQPVGHDSVGNRYYQERRPRAGGLRQRRWVRFNGPEDSTTVPPEWHAWLHYTVDAPLAETGRRIWQKPHLPNYTGTALAYRPPGHDYKGGHRAAATGDYEAWSPDGDLADGSPDGDLANGSPDGDLTEGSPEGAHVAHTPEGAHASGLPGGGEKSYRLPTGAQDAASPGA